MNLKSHLKFICQQSKIATNIATLNSVGITAGVDAQIKKAERIGDLITSMANCNSDLEAATKAKNAKKIISCMKNLRETADALEELPVCLVLLCVCE